MDSCDVLIVGAGPAGSSCAWGLRRSGLDVLILDKCIFPRNKVCGGWITPAVLEELQISHTEYSQGRVFQPLTGFRTSRIGGPEIETDYGKPISYGIRRVEFDEFLLARCGARIFQGSPLKTLERSGDHWTVNGQIKTQLVVGAGGHFCPVARFLGADSHAEIAVVAQETEFEMTSRQADTCSIRPEVPELYFCPDMKGYGWCFRKQNYLNVGLGRLDPHGLPHHVADFVGFLKTNRKLGFDFPTPMQGHAYLLHCGNGRNVVGEGVLLVGDAAGVAYSQSGEGIRPAIESGLLGARAIIAAKGKYDRGALDSYRGLLAARFGRATEGWLATIGRHLPAPVISSAARLLLASKWFSRHVILDHWFLRSDEPAINFQIAGLAG
ncbi:MAG: NAD(P)/FAD-dependent oxidoreductase [Acidobacteriia bacterium]|nr:NAD(P)/FAD-dependent oxidoreductase [Terriglobia bacterium]